MNKFKVNLPQEILEFFQGRYHRKRGLGILFFPPFSYQQFSQNYSQAIVKITPLMA